MEIVVADDHGMDDTGSVVAPILNQLTEQGWDAKYIYREKNLRGDANLYKGYTRDARGQYVWFFCDDDMIDVSEAIAFILKTAEVRPTVALCGFRQGHRGEISNELGDRVRVVTDLGESVHYCAKFSKTSAYLVKRVASPALDALASQWDGSLYVWIGLCVYLTAMSADSKVLLFPHVVAMADGDFGLLRYSHRVLIKKVDVVCASIRLAQGPGELIEKIEKNRLYNDEIVMCLGGLTAHYYPKSPIIYVEKILDQEWKFARQNILRFPAKPRRLIGGVKLIVAMLLHLFSGARKHARARP